MYVHDGDHPLDRAFQIDVDLVGQKKDALLATLFGHGFVGSFPWHATELSYDWSGVHGPRKTKMMSTLNKSYGAIGR